MKKLLLLLAIVFGTVTFTSCNNDDDISDAFEDAFDNLDDLQDGITFE